MDKKMDNWTFVRMCAGGAIAGVAICGIIASALGVEASSIKDAVGIVTGVGAVILLKQRHVI